MSRSLEQEQQRCISAMQFSIRVIESSAWQDPLGGAPAWEMFAIFAEDSRASQDVGKTLLCLL